MGRGSINWSDNNVQKSIDDYVERRIPTQAKLRQIISEHLQQQISEQALSIYLKRNGYSFPRRSPSVDNNRKISDNPPSQQQQLNQNNSPQQFLNNKKLERDEKPASLIIINNNNNQNIASTTSSSSPIKSNTIEGGGSNSTSSGGGGGVQTVPTVFFNNTTFLSESGAILTNANENFGTQNFTINVDSGNLLEPIFNNNNNSVGSSSSRYLITDSSPLSMVRMESTINSGSREILLAENKEPENDSRKISSSGKTASNQQINWNDPVVQFSISEYFDRKIKLQTELRRVIMRRLNRNVSENSLRLYLKKLKSRFVENLQQNSSLQSTSQQQIENFTTPIKRDCSVVMPTVSSTSSNTPPIIHPSATATIVPNEFTYYLYNNFAASSTTGLIQNGINNSTSSSSVGNDSIAAASMIYVNSDHVSPVNTSKMSSLINPRDYGDFNCLRVASTPSTTIMMKSAQNNPINNSNLFAKINIMTSNNPNNNNNNDLSDGGGIESSNIIMENNSLNESIIKSPLKYLENFSDDIKPSVRRRINWNDNEVQIAIQDFYDRKILTQAKLRSIIENILGEVVSEQALSIYLKRKKTRGTSLTQQQQQIV